MKTSSCKAKGREFQKTIANDIRFTFDIPDEDAVSTAMGQQGCDIKLSNAARAVFPFGIECKCQERLNVWEAWEQTKSNAEKEKLLPLLVFRRNRERTPKVVLSWTDFMWLAKEAGIK